VTLAPRAAEGITFLRRHGVAVAIASITWEFAVAWFARQLQVDYFVGTRLEPDGRIMHFWPRDKVTWIQGLRDTLRIPASRIVAIGDSGGDVEMLRAVRHPVFVGATLPGELPGVTHFPGTDIATVAHWIIERLTLEAEPPAGADTQKAARRSALAVRPQFARGPVLPFVLRTFMRYDLHNTRVEMGR
jgi:haloacid dehalogenase-like hydrolase